MTYELHIYIYNTDCSTNTLEHLNVNGFLFAKCLSV